MLLGLDSSAQALSALLVDLSTESIVASHGVERFAVANPAALGAAPIATAAGGHDLVSLQHYAEKYSTALHEFERLLNRANHA